MIQRLIRVLLRDRRVASSFVFLFVPSLLFAQTVTHQFGEIEVFEISDPQPVAGYDWTTEDKLIADFEGSGTVGHISGGANVVVVPEVKVAGNTVVPEVRRDTRSGIRLTTNYQGRAGVELSAGMSVGGDNIAGSVHLGPNLTIPKQAKAGQFYPLVGDFDFGGNLDPPNLPQIDAGIDIILEGTADGTLEVGLYPLAGYQIGEFDFNLPTFRLPVFDFNFPNFQFLCLPETWLEENPALANLCEIPEIAIPDSQEDTTIYRKTLPTRSTQSFGEIAIANPTVTEVTPTELDGHALVTTTSGDLTRAGLDLDGIASYAFSGVSFTGQSIPIKRNNKSIATLGYDTIDVKYGLELGYRIENRVDSVLEATIEFFDAEDETAKNVILRSENDVVVSNTFSGRWDELPEIALLDDKDIHMKVAFTELKRDFNQTGWLTLGDYMELRVLDLKASLDSDVPGVSSLLPSVRMGPLYYQKFDLAGEFADFFIYEQPVELTDPNIVGVWDDLVMLDAKPTVNVYLADFNRPLSAPNLRRLDTHQQLENDSLATSNIIIGTADVTATRRQDIVPGDFKDQGSLVTVKGYSRQDPFQTEIEIGEFGDPTTKTALDGLFLPQGARYTIPAHHIRRFQLRNLENQSAMVAAGFLGVESPDPDSVLAIQGDGTIGFQSAGEVRAGLLFHGSGHTLKFEGRDGWTPAFPRGAARFQLTTPYDPTLRLTSRTVRGTQQLINEGTIISDDSEVDLLSADFTNGSAGRIIAAGSGELEIRASENSTAGSGTLTNTGEIIANDQGTISVFAKTIHGSVGSSAGKFVAQDGSELNVHRASRFSRLRLHNDLSFTAGANSKIVFHDPIDVVNGVTELNVEPSGEMVISGILRLDSPEIGTVKIKNDGLIEFTGGTNSLRPPELEFQGGGESRVDPIDIENHGVVRVRTGARLKLDANIVDYAAGGATFAGGTWEVLGSNVRFQNTSKAGDESAPLASRASIDLRISDVFKASERLDDLVFEELVDEFGNSLRTSINDFDTQLITNAANVTLSGAADFDYFDTIRINRGELRLLNQHQFHTVGSFVNDGGTTIVDSGAGLHINGGLLVDGGKVTFGKAAEFGVSGTHQPEGTDSGRHIEVRGGELTFQPGVNLDPDLISRNAPLGLMLKPNRTWMVSDSTEVADDGSEVLHRGIIDFQIRALDGTSGVRQNLATVIIEGEQAHFSALEEHLTRQDGTLIIRYGKSYETNVEQFFNSGELSIEGAQFRMPSGELRNLGQLNVTGNGYLQVKRLITDASQLLVDGVIDAQSIEFTNAWRPGETNLSDALLIADTIESENRSFSTSGATVMANSINGEFIVNDGKFSAAKSVGRAEIDGDFTQHANGTLAIDWNATAADQVTIAGTASLGGVLEVTFQDGFEPEIGASLEFLQAHNVSGEFGGLSVINAIPNRALILRQDSGRLFLDVIASPAGDFTSNNAIEVTDIDALSREIRTTEHDLRFDLNNDALVDLSDLQFWVDDIASSSMGDADLSGQVDFADFLNLANNFGQMGSWGQGDFDADGIVAFQDFLILTRNFHDSGNVATTPEPGGQCLAILVLLLPLRLRSRHPSGHCN